MRIEIDQSWKIEKTNKLTVIAFSNSKNGVISIKSREKKLIQKYFREIGKPRLFAHFTFAALVFLSVRKEISNGDQIYLDREYPSYEKLINQKIKEFVKENTHLKNISIHTTNIGKNSNAHMIAIKAFNSRDRSKLKNITAREVISVIRKNFRSH